MFKSIFSLFKVVVILNLLVCLMNREWTATFICLFNFVLFFMADFVQKKLGHNNFLHFLIYLFFTSSLLGGEVYFLYVRIWYFDIILHIFSSFIVSWFCFYLIKLFIKNIGGILFTIFIFSFAMMIAAIWEIAEFSIDRLFGVDMQKDTIITEVNSVLLSSDGRSVINKKISEMKIGDYIVNGYIDIGLYDTIGDMICAVIGSIVFIIIFKLNSVVKEASIL